MTEEKVILVNENDQQIGLMPKLEAHEKAVLHRAFSVFIFNDKGELMLQQRALSKYHSPGLWTNTCCSHQRDGTGNYNDVPNINKDEVEAWKWMPLENVKVDIELNPQEYTAWFKIIFDKFYDYINIKDESNS